MTASTSKKYLIISTILHIIIVLALILGVNFTSTLPVVENTNKNDVISAVVLGDTEKSKIIPQQPAPPVEQVKKEEPKPDLQQKIEEAKLEQAKLEQAKLEQAKLEQAKELERDVIALKKAAKKKLAVQKAQELKKRHDLFAKSLLDDIKKTTDNHQKTSQKKLATQFQKNLQQQAEKTLRQQLLNEEIKLQGTQTRESQGEVNKYKALILQSISQHWIIPSQADKSLYCELMIRLAPGGLVLDVQITRSSGDPSLDSSARAAVMKASPLPVPGDTSAFEPFREFVLKVKPENVVSGDGIIGTL